MPPKDFRGCAENDNMACPTMIVVAAGKFTKGSPEGEAGNPGNERLQHDVTIAPFAIGRTEVAHDE